MGGDDDLGLKDVFDRVGWPAKRSLLVSTASSSPTPAGDFQNRWRLASASSEQYSTQNVVTC